MSTRSEIGILNEDGTVTSIYCHWDGYPEYNGAILSKFYTDENLVRELISNGDLSSLRKNINPKVNIEHSFDNPQEGTCIYYHRDRGEAWERVKPGIYASTKQWVSEIQKCWQEYIYLFKNNKWYFTRTSRIKWQKLKNATTVREHDDSKSN